MIFKLIVTTIYTLKSKLFFIFLKAVLINNECARDMSIKNSKRLDRYFRTIYGRKV